MFEILEHSLQLNVRFFTDCEKIIVGLVKGVNQKFSTDFNNLKNTLPAEQASKLDICLNAVNGTS